MGAALKYVVDEKGQKSSVLIPIKEWDDLNDKYNKLLNKVNVMSGIQKGLKEVNDARKAGKKLQTLNDFLREGRD